MTKRSLKKRSESYWLSHFNTLVYEFAGSALIATVFAKGYGPPVMEFAIMKAIMIAVLMACTIGSSGGIFNPVVTIVNMTHIIKWLCCKMPTEWWLCCKMPKGWKKGSKKRQKKAWRRGLLRTLILSWNILFMQITGNIFGYILVILIHQGVDLNTPMWYCTERTAFLVGMLTIGTYAFVKIMLHKDTMSSYWAEVWKTNWMPVGGGVQSLNVSKGIVYSLVKSLLAIIGSSGLHFVFCYLLFYNTGGILNPLNGIVPNMIMWLYYHDPVDGLITGGYLFMGFLGTIFAIAGSFIMISLTQLQSWGQQELAKDIKQGNLDEDEFSDSDDSEEEEEEKEQKKKKKKKKKNKKKNKKRRKPRKTVSYEDETTIKIYTDD